MKKTLLTSFFIISILLLIGIFLIGILSIIIGNPHESPVRPIESESNKVFVTSNACCAMTYDLKLTLHNKQTDENTVICTVKEVSEFDVFEYKLPRKDVEEFQIMLECNVFYGEKYEFRKIIIESSDYNKLKEKGLLIYVQEADGMYINIISDKKHETYKLSDDGIWKITDTPKKIYA